MCKLAIFDLAGTLFDTTYCDFEAYSEVFKKYKVDVDFTMDYFKNECQGRHFSEFIMPLCDYNKELCFKIHDDKMDLFSKYAKLTRKNEHLFRILELLKNDGYKIGLVTSSPKVRTVEILHYTDTFDLFDCIITADDVIDTKPSSECFTKLMGYFNSKPEDTIIFDDSDEGMTAAFKTGASVYNVEKFV